MPLPEKLAYDYVQLADGLLTGTPYYVKSDDDIIQGGKTKGVLNGEPKEVIEALNSIIDPDNKHEVKEHLKDGVESIKELLESPENYVQIKSDYNEYKDIIKSRIKNKIEELESLTPEQENQYRANFANRNEEKQDFARRSKQLIEGVLEKNRAPEGIISIVPQEVADRQFAMELAIRFSEEDQSIASDSSMEGENNYTSAAMQMQLLQSLSGNQSGSNLTNSSQQDIEAGNYVNSNNYPSDEEHSIEDGQVREVVGSYTRMLRDRNRNRSQDSLRSRASQGFEV